MDEPYIIGIELVYTFWSAKVLIITSNPTPLISPIVIPTLSSSDGNIGNWNGLLVNTYVLSSEAIQVSIYNPTASTITTTNTNIILAVSDIVN